MCEVNDIEAALTQAKRKARQVEAEQKQRCQVRSLACVAVLRFGNAYARRGAALLGCL